MAVKKVAVVYLARPKTDLKYIREFARSYLAYASGYDHDLIILGKGLTTTKKLFKDIGHQHIPIPDVGFDIHAYLNFAKIADYEYLLFCNTYCWRRSNIDPPVPIQS